MKVSWRTFDQDKTQRDPRRRRHRARRHQGRPAVRGHRRGVVDRGAERDARAAAGRVPERRSSRPRPSSCARARTSSSSSPTRSTPARRRTSCALAKFEHDTEKENNAAVMTAPVQGPAERALRRGRHPARARAAPATSSARSSTRTSTSRCAARRASRPTPKELEKYDLVLVSDVPAHLMGAGQMAALDTYVDGDGRRPDHGRRRGLVRLGRLRAHARSSRSCRCGSTPRRSRSSPTSRSCSCIDRSGSMQGPKLEAAKESARVTAEVLSPNDYIAVVAFDSEAHGATCGRSARANRMRISNDIARLQSGGGTNIFPGLKEAFEILAGHQRQGEARHPDDRRRGADRRHRRARAGHARVAHHGVVRRRAGRRPQPARR